MILTCPSCSAKYNVPDESLGDKGRDVRCAKCGHTWHQESPKGALDALISRIQSEEMDEILFGDQREILTKADKPKKTKEKISVAVQLRSYFQKKRESFHAHKDEYISQRGAAGAMVAFAVFMCVLLGTVTFRISIAHTIPATTKVFDHLGFYIPKTGRPNAEKTLAFDHLAIQEEEGASPILVGLLINLTPETVDIPPMAITFLDDAQKTLATLPYHLPQADIDPEATTPLHIPLPQGVPRSTRNVTIRFTSD